MKLSFLGSYSSLWQIYSRVCLKFHQARLLVVLSRYIPSLHSCLTCSLVHVDPFGHFDHVFPEIQRMNQSYDSDVCHLINSHPRIYPSSQWSSLRYALQIVLKLTSSPSLRSLVLSIRSTPCDQVSPCPVTPLRMPYRMR